MAIEMTKEAALQLVETYLRRLNAGRPYELVVLDEYTRDEDFGWVFIYNTRRYAETRDRSWALGGNAPLIVDRVTGELHVTGTAHPLQHYIDDYRRKRPQ
jgi:hypothetical protein